MTDLLPDIVAAAAREPEPEALAKAGVFATPAHFKMAFALCMVQ